MNEVIAKAVAELSKDSPNIAYVRGMLETVLAMSVSIPHLPSQLPSNQWTLPVTSVAAPTPMVGTSSTSEADILDAQARAAIAKVQAMTAASQE